MSDRFGEVMLNNLLSRGCLLAGVEACVSLKSQEERYVLILQLLIRMNNSSLRTILGFEITVGMTRER